MQTDPIGYEDQYNLYAYVGNDPINGMDFTGLHEDDPEKPHARDTVENVADVAENVGEAVDSDVLKAGGGLLGRVADVMGIRERMDNGESLGVAVYEAATEAAVGGVMVGGPALVGFRFGGVRGAAAGAAAGGLADQQLGISEGAGDLASAAAEGLGEAIDQVSEILVEEISNAASPITVPFAEQFKPRDNPFKRN